VLARLHVRRGFLGTRGGTSGRSFRCRATVPRVGDTVGAVFGVGLFFIALALALVFNTTDVPPRWGNQSTAILFAEAASAAPPGARQVGGAALAAVNLRAGCVAGGGGGGGGKGSGEAGGEILVKGETTETESTLGETTDDAGGNKTGRRGLARRALAR
jgi:hypothetical protein